MGELRGGVEYTVIDNRTDICNNRMQHWSLHSHAALDCVMLARVHFIICAKLHLHLYSLLYENTHR
jgi:D-alanine-D-alanine ligase-like ATP-grasp enzyme